MSQPTVIDLFAGCGGMTVGFASEGFEPVLAVEWDRFAAATYAANWGEDHVIPGDIAEVKESQIPTADLMIGGPPCQGFSNLGLKALDDPRNQLWREYMRFIRTARPQVFVIENVDRFSKSPEFQMLVGEVEHGLLKRLRDLVRRAERRRLRSLAATTSDHRHRVPCRQDRSTRADARPGRSERARLHGGRFATSSRAFR